MSTPSKQKTEQKLRIREDISIAVSTATQIISLEIDEIKASRTARYWYSKAKEYSEFKEFDNARKELEKLTPGTQEYITQLAKVNELKAKWEEKARKELEKRNNCITEKRKIQKSQEKLFEAENIIITPNTT